MRHDTLADAVLAWHQQAARLLPSGALLGGIDATPFSASTATVKATLHLRAVHVAGHADGESRDESLLAQLKAARAVDDTSLATAQDMLGWLWPRPLNSTAGVAGAVGPGGSAPQTPAARQRHPENAPPEPKHVARTDRARDPERVAPHNLFCTMVCNIKARQPTSQPDATEMYTFGYALGPFGQPWLKCRRMDDDLFPQTTPPKLTTLGSRAHAPNRGVGLFQKHAR
ncbi:hypothetical protein OQA88_1047 [Cercophora sp. LCS_1]